MENKVREDREHEISRWREKERVSRWGKDSIREMGKR